MASRLLTKLMWQELEAITTEYESLVSVFRENEKERASIERKLAALRTVATLYRDDA